MQYFITFNKRKSACKKNGIDSKVRNSYTNNWSARGPTNPPFRIITYTCYMTPYNRNTYNNLTRPQVLFAVTGNEFAFKEAPESMKAVMTSVWLLTEAVGNVIIIVITRLSANVSQVFIYKRYFTFSHEHRNDLIVGLILKWKLLVFSLFQERKIEVSDSISFKTNSKG